MSKITCNLRTIAYTEFCINMLFGYFWVTKIKNRKCYVRKQKAYTSRDNELDLLGDVDIDSFTGSRADLEGAAEQIFASPPRPQLLCFKSPAKTVPPTPGTALQQKIESKLEKSLGSHFNIQLQQQA